MKNNYGRNTHFEENFLLQHMMGPNCLRILEDLTQKFPIKLSGRVMDLGCGKGLSSIFLAKEFNVQVFAVDLWIDPSENYTRFKHFRLEDQIVPIHAEAHELPFAQDYFDAVISIDSFHYYGAQDGYLDQHIIPLVKDNGMIAVSVPGLKKDFSHEVPHELRPFWQEDMNMYSTKWWKKLWEKSPSIEVLECFSQTCHQEAWEEWLECDNLYAKQDIEMMKAEQGKYFDTIGILGKVKKNTSKKVRGN